MKLTVLITAALLASAMSAHPQGQPPVLDINTGLRCSVTFQPATAATDVQIVCADGGKEISTNKLNIAAFTGPTSGYTVTFNRGGETIAIQVRRSSPSAQLHIEAGVNGQPPAIVRDVQVP
jgi:hypothetical protein